MDRFDPDELLVCPYDPVHRVARKRFQGHLVKCRKNYSTKHFAVCPFNAKHVVHKPELSYHISTCEDRGRLEQEIHHNPSVYKAKGNTSMPVHNWRPPSPEESWDDDNVKYVPKEVDGLQSEETPEPRPSPPVEKPKPVTHKNPVVRIPKKPDPQSLVYNYSLERGGASAGTRGRGRGLSPQEPMSTVPLAIGRSKGISGVSQPPPGFMERPSVPSGLHNGSSYPSVRPVPSGPHTGSPYPSMPSVPSGPHTGSSYPSVPPVPSGPHTGSTYPTVPMPGGHHNGPTYPSVPSGPHSGSSYPSVPSGHQNGSSYPSVPVPSGHHNGPRYPSVPSALHTGSSHPSVPGGPHTGSGTINGKRVAVTNKDSPTVTNKDIPTQKDEEQIILLKKRVRKLKKMVKQIQQIQSKKDQGSVLDSDQLAKLGKKEAALASLQKAEEELQKAEA